MDFNRITQFHSHSDPLHIQFIYTNFVQRTRHWKSFRLYSYGCITCLPAFSSLKDFFPRTIWISISINYFTFTLLFEQEECWFNEYYVCSWGRKVFRKELTRSLNSIKIYSMLVYVYNFRKIWLVLNFNPLGCPLNGI